MKTAVIKLLIILVIMMITYITIDGGFGMIAPVKPYAAAPERLTAKAYVHEPYFSEEFLAESFIQPGGWVTPEGTDLIFPEEFHGKFFNVDILPPANSFYRRTINYVIPDTLPPGDENRLTKILILGGSTVYCSEVPDRYTIASILAEKLKSEEPPKKYYILNGGVTSVNSWQELERLKYELGRGLRPDMVIIFDGVNDINQGIYLGNPEGVMFSFKNRSKIKETFTKVIPLNIYYYFRKKSEAETQRQPPLHMNDPGLVTSLAARAKENYKRNILAMKELAGRYNFRLLVMLQPSVYNVGPAIKQESMVDAKKIAEIRTPKIGLAYATGYQVLREAISELKSMGVEAYDASNLFNTINDDIFLDTVHVNRIGNEKIAEEMKKYAIKPTGQPVH